MEDRRHVDYEVSVSQTKPDVRAVNVVITDEIPACLQLLEGQYTVQTSDGAESCTLTRQGDNGWKAECPSLRYGEMITIALNARRWRIPMVRSGKILLLRQQIICLILKPENRNPAGHGRGMDEQSASGD